MYTGILTVLWPVGLRAVPAATARQPFPISYSKLLSRLCCFIIDYRPDTLQMCVNTANSNHLALFKLAVIERLSNVTQILWALDKATVVVKPKAD